MKIETDRFSVTKHTNNSLVNQIKGNVKNLVSESKISAGDKMPSVNSLAAYLGINPNTVYRAYRELIIENVLMSSPGKGTFVCSGIVSTGS